MSQSKSHRLGDLQLRIMKVLWERGEATVAEVHGALAGERELAYTTVATMLRKMEARQLVDHRAEGRTYVFRALAGEAEVSRNMLDSLVDRLFDGSLKSTVAHLLTTRDVSRDELKELEKLIAAKRRKK